MPVAFALGACSSAVARGVAARSTAISRRRAPHQRQRLRAAGEEKENVTISPEDLVREQYKTNEAQDFGDSILGGASIVEGTQEETRDLVPFGANNLAVLRATKAYADAIEADIDPDFIIANTLGRETTSYLYIYIIHCDSPQNRFRFLSSLQTLRPSRPNHHPPVFSPRLLSRRRRRRRRRLSLDRASVGRASGRGPVGRHTFTDYCVASRCT